MQNDRRPQYPYCENPGRAKDQPRSCVQTNITSSNFNAHASTDLSLRLGRSGGFTSLASHLIAPLFANIRSITRNFNGLYFMIDTSNTGMLSRRKRDVEIPAKI